MAKTIRSLKKLSMRRFGYVEVNDELTLPIHTVGSTTLQNALVELDKHLAKKLPKLKNKVAPKETLEEMKNLGFELKTNKVLVTDWDKTSNEFLDYLVESERLHGYMKIAVNIDLKYDRGSDKELWELCELESDNDLIGLCELLIELDLKEEYLRAINMTISHIQNSSFKNYEAYEKALEEGLNKKEV